MEPRGQAARHRPERMREAVDNNDVVLTVQTDFDAETGDELHLAQLAKLPALVLVGAELAEDRFFSINQLPEAASGPGTFAQRRVPCSVDLSFTLVGVTDHTTELLNLMATTQVFFHRNKFLDMPRDPTNPDEGSVRYEMRFTPDGDLWTRNARSGALERLRRGDDDRRALRALSHARPQLR